MEHLCESLEFECERRECDDDGAAEAGGGVAHRVGDLLGAQEDQVPDLQGGQVHLVGGQEEDGINKVSFGQTFFLGR